MKKSKVTIMIIGIVIAMAIVIALIFNIATSSNKDAVVEYRPLESRNLSNGVYCSGVVESKNVTRVYSALNGITVDEVYTSVGSSVKAEDKLCKYNATEISDNISDVEDEISKLSDVYTENLKNAYNDLSSANLLRETKLTVAANNISYYQGKYDSSNSDYNNYKKYVDALPEEEKADSYEYSLMQQSQADMFTYERALENAKLQYNMADTTSQASVDNAQFKIDELELKNTADSDENQKRLDTFNNQLSTATITTPVSGVVTAVNVTKGTVSDNIVAFEISDDSSLQIVCEIYSDSLLDISEGNFAEINFYATDKTINCRGTVTGVVSDSKSSTGFFAIIDVPQECKELLLGMNVSVFIYTEEKPNTLSVAYDEIISDNSGDYIFVAKEFSNDLYEIKKVKVELGIETHYYIEVVSSELSKGDYIICNPSNIKDGDIIDSGQLINIIGAVEE